MSDSSLSFFVDPIPMTIIVTGALRVYRIDLQNRTIDTLPLGEKNFFSYYGISWDENHMFLVDSVNNVLRSSIKVYDKKFNLITTLMPNIQDAHQIQYYDNRLYICDTSKDMCKVYNTRKKAYEEPFFINFGGKDTLHVNSVAVYDNLLYLLCHGKENGASVMVYNIKTRECVDSWAHGLEAHNIVRYKNKFLTCSSEERRMLFKDGSVLYSTSWNTYLRGIALGHNYMCVGESRYSGVDRDARMRGKCFVSVFDVASNKRIGCVVIDSGVIYEVRAISEPDAAHCYVSNAFWN